MKERINKLEKWIKENKGKTVLVTVLVVALIISLTTAVFYTSGSGNEKNITMGTLKVEYIDGQTINGSNALPLTEEEVEEYASKTSFQVKNSGNLTGYAEISLIINSLPTELNSEDFRWRLYKEGEAIKEGSFKGVGSKLVLKTDEVIYPNNTGVNYTIAVWIRDNGGNQNSMLNKTVNAKINIKASDKRGEYAEYGINPPEIAEGMIPVTYDETKGSWVKADINKEWYSYNNQEWANAVTVSSTNRSSYEEAAPGTEISMDDINSMWVWIPRFKYKIPSNIGSSSNVTNPPQIEVVFESGISTTGESIASCPITSTSCYYTHPAFRNGSKVYKLAPYDQGGWDKELAGIWVGKFETSGSATTPTIKPDVVSLRTQRVSTQFDTSLKFAGGTRSTSNGTVTFSGNTTYGLTSSTNTHMMKNTEWGAVAYLSQSRYGKMGNSDYTGTNKEIYINNSSSSYTGRSGGEPSASSSTYGSYSYDDKTCSSSTCTGGKESGKGTGASTTGTIYGVYDMSGGTSERTMSNWEETVADSGFTTSNLPGGSSSKYYEKYTGESSNSITEEKAIKGDATYETMRWYSDRANFLYTSNPWSSRGNNYGYTSNSGTFSSNGSAGGVYSGYVYSFRVVLIP